MSSSERMSSGMYLKTNGDIQTSTFRVPSLQKKGENPFDLYLEDARNMLEFWNFTI